MSQVNANHQYRAGKGEIKTQIPFQFMRTILTLSLAVALFAAGKTAAAEAQRKVAIIVENRAGANLNDKISTLEDLVTSRVAGKGFAIISREVTLNALKTYTTAGITADVKSDTTAKVTLSPDHATAHTEVAESDSAKISATPDTTQLDQNLSDNSSALRLAQNLGADFILIPSITSYGTEKKSYSGNGIQTLNVTHRLRVSYKIVEAGFGGAVHGGSFVSENTTRDSADLQTDSTDTLNSLLDDAADQLADAIVASGKSLPTEVAKAAEVTFKVVCTMTDPRQQPILIDSLNVDSGGKVFGPNFTGGTLQPFDVTVELDGVAIGSAPGEFKATPGLHKIRLTREDFQDWVRTVNIYNSQSLRVALNMNEAGYERWKDTFDFLVSMQTNRKLTDAEVKRLEGVAQMLSKSHYNVDRTENITVTDQPVLMQGATPVYLAPPAQGYAPAPASGYAPAPAQGYVPAPSAPASQNNNSKPTLFQRH
jgi:hypothetical protein